MSVSETTLKAQIPVKQSSLNLKPVYALISLIIGVGIASINPPEGLTTQAMYGLGIMLTAILWWVFNVLPDFVTGMLMLIMLVIFKAVPFGTAFAAYSTTTPWLLIPAFAIGICAQKTGLLKRVSLNVMKVFPATFRGQTLALITAGTIVSPAIPSVTAKGVFASQLAKSIGDQMGYEENSTGLAGLYAAMYQGFVTIYPLFLTGGIFCVLMRGSLPKDVQTQFTWMQWLVTAIPWGIVMFILSYVTIQLLYRPQHNQNLTKEYFLGQLKDLGPMKKEEKITAIITACCLVLWMTEKIHHLDATAVAMLGLIALFAFGIITTQEFKQKIPWELIVFIGAVMALGSVITYLKIDAYLGKVLAPIISPLVSNMFVFIPVAAIFLYLIRFILVAQSSTVMIFTVMFTPFALNAGVNPFIVGFIVLTCVNVWTVRYQNTTNIAALGATGKQYIKTSQASKMSVAYMVINIIGLLVSVVWWKMIGYIV